MTAYDSANPTGGYAVGTKYVGPADLPGYVRVHVTDYTGCFSIAPALREQHEMYGNMTTEGFVSYSSLQQLATSTVNGEVGYYDSCNNWLTATFPGPCFSVLSVDGRVDAGIIRFQNPDNTNDHRDWSFNFGPQRVSLLATRRDDAGQFVEGGPNVTEGDSGYAAGFWLTREKCCPDEPELTVNLSYSGDATASVDYSSLPSQITFAEGQQNYWLPVSVNDDATAEWTETVVAQVASGSDYAASRVPAQVEILDNDAAMTGLPSVMEANYDADQGKQFPDYRYAASLTDNDIYDLTLAVPQTLNPEARVRLVASAAVNGGQVRIWPAGDASHSIIDTRDQSQQSWTWRAANLLAPLHLRAEAVHGSADIGDIVLTLSVIDGANTQPVPVEVSAVGLKIKWTDPTTGTIIDGVGKEAPPVLVGQHIQPELLIEAPASWKANPTYDWTIPGDTFKQYEPTTASAVRTNLSGADTHIASPEFFWATISGNLLDGQAKSEEKTLSVTVGNINGQSYTMRTTVPVWWPEVTIREGPVPFTKVPLLGPPALELWPGTTFQARVELPGWCGRRTGAFRFAQTVVPHREYAITDGQSTLVYALDQNGGTYLDTSYPYKFTKEKDPGLNNQLLSKILNTQKTVYLTGDQGTFGDSPSQGGQAGITWIDVDDSFSTYVILRPPGADPLGDDLDSRQVAVARLDWAWNAEYGNGRVPPYDRTPPALTRVNPDLPEWSQALIARGPGANVGWHLTD